MKYAPPIHRCLSFLFVTATALLPMTLATSRGYAAQVTFAQFQQNSAGSPFVFTNSGAASTFAAVSVPVNFQYLVPNSYGAVNQNIPSILTLSAVVAAPAISLPPLVGQSLQQVSITILANTAVNGDSLLLKVDVDGSGFSTAALAGALGGHFGLQAADTDFAVGSNFAYSSDFVAIDPSEDHNYSMSFSSLFPSLTINGNGYLNRFTASGTGTFAATIVPEPCTAGLALAGAGILLGAIRRRAGAKCGQVERQG
jgi:hypothetical protein